MSALWYVNACLAVALVAVGLLASRALTVPTPSTVYAAAAPRSPPRAEAVLSFPPDSLAAFGTTLAKPVFSPNRSPAPRAEKTDEVASAGLKGLALRGILLEGGEKTALFWSARDGEALSFALSDRIGDWTILDMTPKSVILGRNGEQMTLPLTIEAALDAAGDKGESGPAARHGSESENRGRSVAPRTLVDGATFLTDDDS